MGGLNGLIVGNFAEMLSSQASDDGLCIEGEGRWDEVRIHLRQALVFLLCEAVKTQSMALRRKEDLVKKAIEKVLRSVETAYCHPISHEPDGTSWKPETFLCFCFGR